MDRRDFIKTGMVVTAATSLDFGLPLWVRQAFAENGKDLVAVLGGNSPVDMLQRTVQELGGIEAFIKKGDRVVIKPNIGWAKTPELGANTSPEVIGELVKLSFEAGAGRVEVFDHTCQEWKSCYELSGIKEAVESHGGTMVPGNNERYYTSVSLPKGKVLKETKIHKSLINSDVWFNVPTLKHHGGASMSIAMKNNMGIVWDRRIFHRSGLQQCIADLCTWEKKPTLNIVDGFRTMVRNGPSGISVEDVAQTRAMFTSSDPVAVDTAATKFFSQLRPMDVSDVSHIQKGEESGLGTTDLASLNIKRVKL
ncbi:DUF362 domain-containing protein [Desulfosediminicola sp.]|uniref:DUF362 domain-containing protein n=1 Tax=Desulfosediminicola sp. TaxID=2886825 RepID=UPI003AF28F24